jgi:hypothetical protein
MQKRAYQGIIMLVVALGLFVTGCDRMMNPLESRDDAGIAWHWVIQPETHTLWAGKNINAGSVTVWNTLETLYVKYEMAGNWWLDETHVAVATTLSGIPQKNGNPIPGRFSFKTTHDPRVQTYTYAIVLQPEWSVGTELYIATHAAAAQLDDGGNVLQRQTGWAGPHDFPGKNWAKYLKYTVKKVYKDVNLPTGQVRMRGFYPGSQSYWDIELAGVPTGFDVWDGMWRGWCAEQYVYMTPGVWYDVVLWSTADPNLPQRCANAGWDNVNYLLNHKVPGATSLQVEQAIWWLVGCGSYPTDPVAKAMADDAAANGDGWYPSSGDWIAVIMETAANVQLCFIEVDP